MATRSSIGIELETEEVLSIYCHWDGYPSHNGVILHEFYKDREKVMSLIELGDISTLGPEVSPKEGSNHSYESPDPEVTVAYHRDREEEYSKPQRFSTAYYFSKGFNQEWGYLFTKSGEWMVTRGSGNFKPLADVIGSHLS